MSPVGQNVSPRDFSLFGIDLLADGLGQAGDLAVAMAVEDEVSMAAIGLEGAHFIRELV